MFALITLTQAQLFMQETAPRLGYFSVLAVDALGLVQLVILFWLYPKNLDPGLVAFVMIDVSFIMSFVY